MSKDRDSYIIRPNPLDTRLTERVTGVDQPYEAPEAPELTLNSAEEPPEALADRVIKELEQRGHIVTL